MEKWVCGPCGFVYDPEVGDPDSGVEPGTKFEDLPDDWVCPVCGATKDMFESKTSKFFKGKQMLSFCFLNWIFFL